MHTYLRHTSTLKLSFDPTFKVALTYRSIVRLPHNPYSSQLFIIKALDLTHPAALAFVPKSYSAG